MLNIEGTNVQNCDLVPACVVFDPAIAMIGELVQKVWVTGELQQSCCKKIRTAL
jgi:hypothetical protein